MFAMGENRLRLWPKLWYVNIIQFILNKINLWVVADILGLGGVCYSKLMWLEIIAPSDLTIPLNKAFLLGYIFRVQQWSYTTTTGTKTST